MNEIWNARRALLEESVTQAALNLFEHTGSGAFKLQIKGSPLFIIVGNVLDIRSLMTDTEAEESLWPECYGCGGEINPDYGKCRRCG